MIDLFKCPSCDFQFMADNPEELARERAVQILREAKGKEKEILKGAHEQERKMIEHLKQRQQQIERTARLAYSKGIADSLSSTVDECCVQDLLNGLFLGKTFTWIESEEKMSDDERGQSIYGWPIIRVKTPSRFGIIDIIVRDPERMPVEDPDSIVSGLSNTYIELEPEDKFTLKEYKNVEEK